MTSPRALVAPVGPDAEPVGWWESRGTPPVPTTAQITLVAVPSDQVIALGTYGGLGPIQIIHSDPNPVSRMQAEIKELKARVATLEKEVGELKASEEVMVLRTISREDAKGEIKNLFDAGGTWYYSDIAHQLRLDLSLVVELCQELQKEGEIQVDDDAV